jgi:hypothetical protein
MIGRRFLWTDSIIFPVPGLHVSYDVHICLRWATLLTFTRPAFRGAPNVPTVTVHSQAAEQDNSFDRVKCVNPAISRDSVLSSLPESAQFDATTPANLQAKRPKRVRQACDTPTETKARARTAARYGDLSI